MTPRVKDNAASDAVEVLMSNGMEGLAGAVEILINAAMCIERSHYLGVGPYERSAERALKSSAGVLPICLSGRTL